MTYDQPIYFQERVETRDAAGGIVATYTDMSPHAFAKVAFPGGKEFRALGQLANDCSALFEVRTNPTVTEKHRIRWGARLFNILWVEPATRQPSQRITAKEIRP